MMTTTWRNRFKLSVLITMTSMMLVIGVVFPITLAQQDDDERNGGRDCTTPMNVQRVEPQQITNGEARTITVFGSGFDDESAVRLGDYGVLVTTLVNASAVTAEVPANIGARVYNVRIVDPDCDKVPFENPDRLKLTVFDAPLPSPTFGEIEPPTETPGSPSLIARTFTASPTVVEPGGTVTLFIEVYNQGNRVAEAVSIELDAGGSFLPTGGSVTLPNIPPLGAASVTLTASVAQAAEAGPAAIPVTITYRDFTGESYESKENGSVSIEQVVQSTQLVLESYPYTPNPAVPGEPITVFVTIKNTGNTPALQSLLTISGDSSVLLAGPQGDTFPLMDLQPGASASVDLPLIVSPEAKPGPQSQAFSISYLLNGEAQKIDSRLTINVARVAQSAPTMLLEAVGFDTDPIKPGDQFSMTVILKNVGEVSAVGMLVTFGTVEEDPDDDDGNGGGSSTTPSSTFAPLGTGGTLFIGDVAADDTTTFTQDFIVNGTTTSGIYSLPITLRYIRPDGTRVKDDLRATVVVIKPPPLQINLQVPPVEFVTIGEPITLTYDLVNGGSQTIQLTNATTEADTGEVIEGAETLIGPVLANDQGLYNVVVIPYEEGQLNIAVTIRYLDDLNNEREVVNNYVVEVAAPPEIPEEEPTPDLLPTPTPEPEADSDWIGRLLLGLLGLGS